MLLVGKIAFALCMPHASSLCCLRLAERLVIRITLSVCLSVSHFLLRRTLLISQNEYRMQCNDNMVLYFRPSVHMSVTLGIWCQFETLQVHTPYTFEITEGIFKHLKHKRGRNLLIKLQVQIPNVKVMGKCLVKRQLRYASLHQKCRLQSCNVTQLTVFCRMH